MSIRSKETRLTTGSLSKKSGCHVETIRYYERIGLLPEPARSSGGHRIYDADALKRLSFIVRTRELGFSIEEIRELLSLVDGEKVVCSEVEQFTLEHAERIRTKIKDLRKIEKTLRSMASQCSGRTVPECPVIEELYRQ